MGKTCLNYSGYSIPVDCSIPRNGVNNIYLMFSDLVTLNEASDKSISAVTWSAGARSYKIEGYKQNIQVTTAVRPMDASNKLDISVMFKIPNSLAGSLYGTGFQRAILTHRFYVLVEMNDSSKFMVGSISPLECSGFDMDSNTNGSYRTITLTAPDGSSGNYLVDVAPAAYNDIKSKSV